MYRHARTTRLAVVCCVTALAACAKTADKAVADTTSMPGATTATAAGAMAAPTIALADVAGTWKMHAVPTSGADMTATDYTLTATADAGGWKLAFPNGLTVPATVMASGDSIIVDAGPYKSVRRKGVDVTTHGAFRKSGDKLVGTTVAHYSKGADSVLTLRLEGTKVP